MAIWQAHPGCAAMATDRVMVCAVQAQHLVAGPRRLSVRKCRKVLGGKAAKSFLGLFSDEAARICSRGSKLLRIEILSSVERVKRRQWIVFVTSALAMALTVSIATTLTLEQSAMAITEENLLFLEAWRTLDRAYVDKTFNGQSWFSYRENALRQEPMFTREETYAAIRKMVATLGDPFTRFLEPDQFRSLESDTSGALTGIGLEFGFETNSDGQSEIVVIDTLQGGPAARAGVVQGDVILEIDGQKVQDLSLYQAANKLKGPENTTVMLSVLSKGSNVQRTVPLTRQKIVVNPVSWKLCEISSDGSSMKLGYIRLSTFNQNSASAFKQAVEKLHEKGASAYVLDIRNNRGGYFPAAVDIAKLWLNDGIIVNVADNVGVRDIYSTSGGSAIAPSEPLAVLVNKATASASEVLAGALKDNDRAVLLGEPTFGKGKIQSVFRLSDGSGLVVTTARYQTPNMIDIDKVGVAPDHPLPQTVPSDGEKFCKCLDGLSGCGISVSDLFTK